MYEYKGYKYSPSKEYEEDNIKIWHDVLTPEGELVFMDWSPYSYPKEDEFKAWIELGMPKRVGSGPLDKQDLKNMLIKKSGTYVLASVKRLLEFFK